MTAAAGIDAVADEVLGEIRARGRYRRMRMLEGTQGPRMDVDGRAVLLFAGSNYLDLANHPEVVAAAQRAARDVGCAAGGSRLINGNTSLHESLEEALATFLGTEAALVFASGYMANVGVIPALVGKEDVLVSDALSHASIVDGGRLSKARVAVFAHGDAGDLERVLARERGRARRLLVVCDGVYSMDGDLAPLPDFAAAARRYDALLLLDDAHGFGALGPRGRGTAEHFGLELRQHVDIYLGTLGKTLGSFGAFVACSALARDLLINTARSFIFSCALAPPQVAAAEAALRIVEREPERRQRLAARAARLRDGLAAHGIDTHPSETHIVPVRLGDNATAMAVCGALLEQGFFAQGIRYPSVPEGTARLRLTPMASHTEAEIDALVETLAKTLASVRE
ncbi:MAG: 8-amino-7-oxononanoate synthase [Proteobacteria bacterium]|nr:8-amino-7-oxononanoate synthase [Pseudomonadota bacterium]